MTCSEPRRRRRPAGAAAPGEPGAATSSWRSWAVPVVPLAPPAAAAAAAAAAGVAQLVGVAGRVLLDVGRQVAERARPAACRCTCTAGSSRCSCSRQLRGALGAAKARTNTKISAKTETAHPRHGSAGRRVVTMVRDGRRRYTPIAPGRPPARGRNPVRADPPGRPGARGRPAGRGGLRRLHQRGDQGHRRQRRPDRPRAARHRHAGRARGRLGAPGAAPAPSAWIGVGLLVAFGAWCALSISWSISPDESWIEANRAWGYALAAGLAVVLGASLARAPEKTALAFTGLATVVAAYALGGKVLPGRVRPRGRDLAPARAGGLLERARPVLRAGGAAGAAPGGRRASRQLEDRGAGGAAGAGDHARADLLARRHRGDGARGDRAGGHRPRPAARWPACRGSSWSAWCPACSSPSCATT